MISLYIIEGLYEKGFSCSMELKTNHNSFLQSVALLRNEVPLQFPWMFSLVMHSEKNIQYIFVSERYFNYLSLMKLYMIEYSGPCTVLEYSNQFTFNFKLLSTVLACITDNISFIFQWILLPERLRITVL